MIYVDMFLRFSSTSESVLLTYALNFNEKTTQVHMRLRSNFVLGLVIMQNEIMKQC